jgi:hypothetical protein
LKPFLETKNMNPETKTLRDWFACNEKLAEWDDFEVSASKAMLAARQKAET